MLNFAIQIAIARMLGPEEFGLYAFVLAINSFVAIVGAFSLGFALIQAREESQELYDTAFILSAGLGLIVLLVSLGIAPLLWIHRSPRAAYFLLVMALAQVFFLVAAIPNARMERALKYGPLTIISMTTSTTPNLVALGMVWALGVMRLLGLSFNFANLVAVPLIVGVGIDNGVHIVHRVRLEGGRGMVHRHH